MLGEARMLLLLRSTGWAEAGNMPENRHSNRSVPVKFLRICMILSVVFGFFERCKDNEWILPVYYFFS
jgi:hypothetical protein